MELIELFVLIETQSLKFSSLILDFGVEFWNLEVILSGSLTLFCDLENPWESSKIVAS